MLPALEDLMLSGIDEASARAYLGLPAADAPDDEFLVFPGNWQAVMMFQDLGDCWVFPPMGGKPLRIDRGEMLATFEMRGVKKRERSGLLDRLLCMQHEALAVMQGRKS